MSSKPDTKIRNRIEGDRAAFAVAAVNAQGLTVDWHARLGDDTGYSVHTHEGPVINIYDTGTITVTGNFPGLLGDRNALRMPGKAVSAPRDANAPYQMRLEL